MTRYIRIQRTELLRSVVECQVEVPDDIADDIDNYDPADLEDLLADLTVGEEVDEEVIDVIDTSPWEIVSQ